MKIRNCDSSDSSCLWSSFFTFSTASVFWGLSWSRLSRNWMSGILVSTLFVWSALLRNLRWLRRRITYSSRLQSPRGLFDEQIEGLGKGNQIINHIWHLNLLSLYFLEILGGETDRFFLFLFLLSAEQKHRNENRILRLLRATLSKKWWKASMKSSNQLTCRQRIQPISGLLNQVTATLASGHFADI